MPRRGPPNLVSTVRRFSFPIFRRRYTAAVVTSEGLTTDSGYEEAEGLAHVYPATGYTIERLPEGLEGRSAWEGSTDLELSLGDRQTGRRPDSIVVPSLGIELELVSISPYASGQAGAVTWIRFVAVEVQR